MSDKPILNQLNLVVSDMDATVAFYRRLGLDVDDTAAEWAQDHRTAAAGAVELEFDSARSVGTWNHGWPDGRRGAVLGFSVATRQAVDDLYDDLISSGAASQQPPFDAFWGSRFAVVQDPDGNAVGLMSPMDPARQSAPS